MALASTKMAESALFAGNEFKECIEWARERSDERIIVNVQGLETFDLEGVVKNLPKALVRAGLDVSKRIFKEFIYGKDAGILPKDISKFQVFKEIELQGILLKASRGFRKNFLAVSVVTGTIGDTDIPEGTILTIGSHKTVLEDVRTNVIQLDNQFKKNYEARKFFDGRELNDVYSYLGRMLETTNVNAQVWGVWSKTKQTFFGRGKVLRVTEKQFPRHKYFILMLEEGMVGQTNTLEKGRIIRV
nr:hypothetical protein [Candidatus Sigynarchaeota archaeon]